MMKVLILVAHRPNRSPSQRYRFEQYIPFLESKNYSFKWSPLLNERDDKIFYSQGRSIQKAFILIKTVFIRLKDAREFKNTDIIFIQREASFIGTSYFERQAKLSGKKVIFDFDDAIWLEDTSPGNKKWSWIKWPGKFFDNISYATTVIAGNSFLADKAKLKNKNVHLIPTTVNTDYHVPMSLLRQKGVVVIGWSGSISTIKHFESIVPVLIKLKDTFKNEISFKVMGDESYQNAALGIKGTEWTSETEVAEINSFDIGIMPLPENKWTEGKCGLKALTYMACEVPVVLSNIGVNKEIVENNKTGILVNTPDEWYEALSNLIQNKQRRMELGAAGRKVVIDKYSVKANQQKYLKAFINT